MFYISSKKDNLFGVTDTSDGVEEMYTIEQLLAISNQVDIEGIFGIESGISVVAPPQKVVDLFNQGNFANALSLMSSSCEYDLRFRSKPRDNGDGTAFVSNQQIRVWRNGVDNFSMDKGYYKSHVSDLTRRELYDILSRYFVNYSSIKATYIK